MRQANTPPKSIELDGGLHALQVFSASISCSLSTVLRAYGTVLSGLVLIFVVWELCQNFHTATYCMVVA